MKCTIYIRMIPGGEVIEARVVQSSGDPNFDSQAEGAVRRASPLPVPDDARLFHQYFREMKLVFEPEG